MPTNRPSLLKRSGTAIATGAVALLVAVPALAQVDLGLNYATAIGLTTTDIRTTVARIISYFLGFLGMVAVLLILYAGFVWMTAGGAAEKIDKAKKIMINAVIGLVIIMSAFAITQFIFRAIEEGAGGGVTAACPEGQVCGGGCGLACGGGGGGFRIDGTSPAGPGPSDGGWPKNYAITVAFNAAVAEGSVNPSTVEVRKCNPRLDGGGDPQPFSLAACTEVVSGTLVVDNNRIRFRPNATPGPEPTDFEGDFWYKIRLQGGAVRDLAGRTLLCPLQTTDISLATTPSDYCERGIAINNLRDVAPPTVVINGPAANPAYCVTPTFQRAQILATATDDFLVAGIDFLLDGGTANLQDGNGDPASSAANGGNVNPFTSDSLYVNLAGITNGQHTLRAVAQDGVPQASAPAERTFSLKPAHCCNGVLDAADGETAIDCGGECLACSGSSCTEHSQCASGFCDPATNQCADRPVINEVDPMAAGPGSIVTIRGQHFGTTPGGVVFLGDPNIDTDDVAAAACAPQAWEDDEVAINVPTGALSGPIRLITAAGGVDETADDFGPMIGSFTVDSTTLPGLCYLNPDEGAPGTKFAINGAGFGDSIGGSQVFMGSHLLTVATCGPGETDCGWGPSTIWVVTPPIAENTYPVKAIINGQQTNERNYLLRLSSTSTGPRVTAVLPDDGPVGSYVTIQGSGFGTIKGSVKFKFGATDVAIAEEPICDDNWHDNYIIVKVPPEYQGGLDLNASSAGVAHKVQVTTAPPTQNSNDDVTFKVTDAPPRPGICSISPDNGPPGNVVIVSGEGFGGGPPSAIVPGPPRNSVEFFKANPQKCLFSGAACAGLDVGDMCSPVSQGVCMLTTMAAPDASYSLWTGTQIGTLVPGDRTVRSTWPATGPVYVVANNQASSNAVPFTVQDCNESGATCPVGTQCCPNGSCKASCEPEARASAYGWRFSTNVLPSLPMVVERAMCNVTADPPVAQTPSPFIGATDACKNAYFYVEFNRYLDKFSFDSNSVVIEECGDQNAISSTCTPVPLQPFTEPGTFGTCGGVDGLQPDVCKTFRTRPHDAYNSHYWKPNFWYKVTLASRPGSGVGLKEYGSGGRYLDGDKDKIQGGDYVTTFRVRNSNDPCQLSNVMIDPPVHTIAQDQTPDDFTVDLLSGNCNILMCGPSEPYLLDWTVILSPTAFLELQLPALNAGCTQPVFGRAETPPGAPTPLTAAATPLTGPLPGGTPTGPAKSGVSDVTVKFADPRVIAVTPTAGCTQACINAEIEATFNVPMDRLTLDESNVELKRCRNSACQAPFLPTTGTTWSVDEVAEPGSSPTRYKAVRVVHPTPLQPATWYLVRIKGGASGVKSASGVPLSGLNEPPYYTWKFRTKDDPEACSVAYTTISPDRVLTQYVGQRKDLQVNAFGDRDECSPQGQRLTAISYDWDWILEANKVVQGFIDGIGPFAPVNVLATPTSTVDTKPLPKKACNGACLYKGSQNVIPQCGNGLSDLPWEDPGCDLGSGAVAAGCNNQCIRVGTADPTCGNGTFDPGEQCERGNVCSGGANNGLACTGAPDCPGGSCVAGAFPAGCKAPDATAGCLFLGASSVPATDCGDGFIGDGEACDDGNTANGDGCSADCLREGTGRSCDDPMLGAGEVCVNFCGNGVDETGEDPDCDGPGGVAAGCDPETCLKTGRPACPSPPAGANCCGNNVTDAGEDPECEDPLALNRDEYCTSRCLLKGSSAFYTEPSFCGDGIVGRGEKTFCEPSDAVENPALVDPYQVLASAPQAGFTPGGTDNSTQVRAVAPDMDPADAGTSLVSMACNCKNEPPGSQDSYCADLNRSGIPGHVPPYTDNYACADNGCCTPRPCTDGATCPLMPVVFNSCRNAEISIEWSEEMNPATITPNFLVGYNNGTSPCPAGSVVVPPLASAQGASGSWWQRLWQAISGFFHTYVIRPVFGSPPSPPTLGEQGETYCSVTGTVTNIVVESGPPGATIRKTVTYFAVQRALPANRYVRVRLNPGVKSLAGVPIPANGITHYFATGPSICLIDNVSVTPPSVLLAEADESRVLTAHANASNGQAIVPTLDYNWDWVWTPQLATPPNVSPIVLTPRVTSVVQCTLGGPCAGPATCPCTIAGATCQVGVGDSTCNVTPAQAHTSIAEVRVRGSNPLDSPAGYKPKRNEPTRTADVAAVFLDNTGITNIINGHADVKVMLCKNPWPKYQTCSGGNVVMPWDTLTTYACGGAASLWMPFYDPLTNVQFSYCRDLEAAPAGGGGASLPPGMACATGPDGKKVCTQLAANGASTLPCLKEAAARVITPGVGILREYLMTFDAGTSNCPGGPPSAPWIDDAVGLRISTNEKHLSVKDWYASKGFRGAPQALTVGGYDAIREGRTVYANAAARTPDGKLYTNVNVLSYSDGAEAETTAIFNQIVSDIDFNRNPQLVDRGLCRVAGAGSLALGCVKDEDCRVDAAGTLVPGRDAFTCIKDAAERPPFWPYVGVCKNGSSIALYAGTPVPCSANVDCKRKADGTFDPFKSASATNYLCDAPKSKLIRDVRRWSDLQTLRQTIASRRDANGRFPTLDAGTFLRAQTNSTWPSWSQVLAAALQETLPSDPLNQHSSCTSGNCVSGFCENVPTAACTQNSDCVFDEATCWAAGVRIYRCPAASHVYEYRSIGGQDFQIRNDFEYKYGSDTWSGTTCLERTTQVSCVDATCAGTCSDASANKWATCTQNSDCLGGGSCCFAPGAGCSMGCNYRDGKILAGGGAAPLAAAVCTGTPIGAGGSCGDGILAPGEVCEIGQTKADFCDADPLAGTRSGSFPSVCNNACQWVVQGRCAGGTNNGGLCTSNVECPSGTCVNWTNFKCVGGVHNGDACTGEATCDAGNPSASDSSCVSACVGGYCGDGVKQSPPEFCDDGPLNGTYGHCTSNCQGYGLACGDGQKQPNEACDCYDKNGQYYFDGVLAPASKYGIDGQPACGTFASGQGTPSCSWDCAAIGPRCGDGVVNDSEECDGGFEEYKGYCNDTAQTGCNDTGSCPEQGTCVSGNCSVDTAKSCTTDADCVEVCGDFCPTPEQKRRRECGVNNPKATGDNATACTWSAWFCTAPGSCGNGQKETGEECDDGNNNNNDGCIIDPAKGVMCKTAKCGDGYVYPVTGEECDDGADNGRLCTSDYGLTCNYCNGACRVSTITGGYCGDNLVQDGAWVPPGPESCDGTTGLSNDWVCVSTKPQHQSYGRVTGKGLCRLSNCAHACADPESTACENVGDNGDNDTCPPSTGPGRHSSGTNWCNYLKTAPVLSLTPGGFAGLGGTASQTLKDSCDPDIDNDGVPNSFDTCGPDDANVHSAYSRTWTPAEGGYSSINIPEVPEVCGDSKDNNCNGIQDGLIKVKGKYVDVQTGTGMVGGMIEIVCDGTVVHEEPVASNGDYDINIEKDVAPCRAPGVTQFKVRPKQGSPVELCVEEKTFPLAQGCPTGSGNTYVTANFEISKKPPPGTVRATIQWTQAGLDLDFHLYSSSGKHLYYGSGGGGSGYYSSVVDGDKTYTLDVDDQGAGGNYDPGGIETITVPRKDETYYDFLVHDYDGANNWPAYGLKMRVYYDNCSTYVPEGFGVGMNFLTSGPPFVSFIRAYRVNVPRTASTTGTCDDMYDFCCYPGNNPGPCPGMCSNVGGHTSPNSATWAEHDCRPPE